MSRNATDINETDAARDEHAEDAARDDDGTDVNRHLDDLSSAAGDLADAISEASRESDDEDDAQRRRATDPDDDDSAGAPTDDAPEDVAQGSPPVASGGDDDDDEDEDGSLTPGASDEDAEDDGETGEALSPMLDDLEEQDRQRREDPEGWERKQVDPAGAIDAILADVSEELDPPAEETIDPLEGDFEAFEDEEAAQQAAATATPAATPQKERGPSPLIALLVAINKPFANLSPAVRDTLGLVGLMTLLNAMAVWVTLLWVLPSIPAGGKDGAAAASHKPAAAKAPAKDHAAPPKKPASSGH